MPMNRTTDKQGGVAAHGAMPDIPLRDPAYLRGIVTGMPISLTVMSLLAVYFKPGLYFATLILPPFVIWSCWQYRWVRGAKLSGDTKADRETRLEVTIRSFMYLQVAGVVASALCLNIALGALTVLGQMLSQAALSAIVACYILVFGLSFLLPRRFLQAEVDAAKTSPRTRAGRVLRRLSRIPTDAGLIAGFGIAVVTVLRALGSGSWIAAVAGGLGLFCAFGTIAVVTTSFHKWQYLRRLREAEFGGSD
jgi:hypothetical protein